MLSTVDITAAVTYQIYPSTPRSATAVSVQSTRPWYGSSLTISQTQSFLQYPWCPEYVQWCWTVS